MWPYPWTHVGTPSHLGHMDRVAATMPSQAHAGAAQEVPDIGQWEGQDVPLVRPSSCNVKRGIPSSRRYLPTYLPLSPPASRLLSLLSSPIRSLLMFLFSSQRLSAAVSFSLFVAPDIPFPGRFVPGRSSPGALRPRMFQSAAPGAPPDDPVRGFGPCSCPPRMLQSGASFCRN